MAWIQISWHYDSILWNEYGKGDHHYAKEFCYLCAYTTYYLVSPFPEFVLQRVISCIYQSQRILEIVLIIIMNLCYANYAREQNKQKVQQRKKVTQLLNADKGV